MKNSENKIVKIGIRLNKEERLHLEQLAIQVGAPNLSAFIRMRLFDDEIQTPPEAKLNNVDKAKHAYGHDIEMMKLMIQNFILTKEIAYKALGETKVKECNSIIEAKLQELNYIE